MRRSLFFQMAILALGACQNASGQTPAILADDSPKTMAALKAGLSDAMGRTFIELGASDPTKQSTVSVLPLPLRATDDRSLERPTLFDLVLEDGICYAIRHETKDKTPLPNVACRPL